MHGVKKTELDIINLLNTENKILSWNGNSDRLI